jgi:uncharacterized membrane protein YvbJ
MVYCHNCGEKLQEDALFCPKCGKKRTQDGSQSNNASTSDEMRDAFSKMSQELEKAFNVAAKEIQQAFQTARANVQKSIYGEPIVCPNCGEKNPADSTFCFKCGNKLASDASKGEPSADQK